jgi:hypothetical protein
MFIPNLFLPVDNDDDNSNPFLGFNSFSSLSIINEDNNDNDNNDNDNNDNDNYTSIGSFLSNDFNHIENAQFDMYIIKIFEKISNEIHYDVLKSALSPSSFKFIEKLILPYEYLFNELSIDDSINEITTENYNIINSVVLEKNITDLIFQYKQDIEYTIIYEHYKDIILKNYTYTIFHNTDFTTSEKINIFTSDVTIFLLKEFINEFSKKHTTFDYTKLFRLTFSKNKKFNDDIFNFANKNYKEFINWESFLTGRNVNTNVMSPLNIIENINQISHFNIIKIIQKYKDLNTTKYINLIIKKCDYDVDLVMLLLNNKILPDEQYLPKESNIIKLYSEISEYLTDDFILKYQEDINWNSVLEKKYLTRNFLENFKNQVLDYYLSE